MKKNFELNLFPAVLIYIFLILLVTFPAIVKLNTVILGSRYTDTWNALWGINYVKESILKGGGLFYTDEIFYPDGGYFYPINLVNGIFVLPVYLFLSLPASYNLMIMLLMLISALGMYRLVFYIFRDKNASFYAGLCYSISPLVITAIHNGTDELLGLCWIPFYILALFKAIYSKKLKSIFLTILFLFLTSISCWYLCFSLGLFTLFLLIYYLIMPNNSIFKKRVALKIISILSISTLLCLPFFSLFLRSLFSKEKLIHIKNRETVELSLKNINYTDINSFFKIYPYWSRNKNDFPEPDPKVSLILQDKYFRQGLYLGYIVLGLGLLGLFFGRGVKFKFFWLGTAFFYFLLSLGPYPRVNGAEITAEIILKSLPFSIFKKIIPGFSLVSLPFRFIIMGYLSLFILGAGGLVEVFRKIKISPVIFTLFISTLTLLEYLFIAPVPYPLRYAPAVVPEFVSELKDMAGEAIIEVPINDPTYRALRPGLYYQIYHHKKVSYSLDAFEGIAPSLKQNVFINYLDKISSLSFKLVTKNTTQRDHFLEGEYKNLITRATEDYKIFQEAIMELKRLSFSYIVVYKDLLPQEVDRILEQFLEAELGAPLRESEKIAIYYL